MLQAVRWYEQATTEQRLTALGALAMHNHVPSFEWDWEHFAWQYTAFDAAWRLARLQEVIPQPPRGRDWPHEVRFPKLSKIFRMRRNTRIFRRWVACRNKLVHQAIWGRVIPGHAPRNWVVQQCLPLRGFTTIALLASIGCRGRFLRARWSGPARELLEI